MSEGRSKGYAEFFAGEAKRQGVESPKSIHEIPSPEIDELESKPILGTQTQQELEELRDNKLSTDNDRQSLDEFRKSRNIVAKDQNNKITGPKPIKKVDVLEPEPPLGELTKEERIIAELPIEDDYDIGEEETMASPYQQPVKKQDRDAA